MKCVVMTRSWAKLMAYNLEEPPVIGESSMSPKTIFKNKMLDRIHEITLEMDTT